MQHKLVGTFKAWGSLLSKTDSKTERNRNHPKSLPELEHELNVVLERIRNIELSYFNGKNFSAIVAIDEHLSPISQHLQELFASCQVICKEIYQKVSDRVGKKSRLSEPTGLIAKIADKIENFCHRIKHAADKKLTLEEYNKIVDEIGRIKLLCGNLNDSVQYLINHELKDELRNIIVFFPPMQKSMLMSLIEDLESNGEKDELIALLKRYILSHEVVKINLDGIIQPSDFVSSLNEKEKKFAYDYYVYHAILEEEQRSAAYRVLSSGAKLATLHNLKQIGSLSQDVWVDEILPKLNREGRSRLARSCSFFPPLVSAVNSRVKKHIQRDYGVAPLCLSLKNSSEYLVSLDQNNLALSELSDDAAICVMSLPLLHKTRELTKTIKFQGYLTCKPLGSIINKLSDDLIMRNDHLNVNFYIWNWKTGKFVQEFIYPNEDNKIKDVARSGDGVLFAVKNDENLNIYSFKFNGERIINDIGIFQSNLILSARGVYSSCYYYSDYFAKLLANKAGVICALTKASPFTIGECYLSKIIVWNKKKEPVFLFDTGTNNEVYVNDICLLDDNHLIGFCTDQIMIWNLRDFQLIKTMQLDERYYEGRVIALPDGKVVVAGTHTLCVTAFNRHDSYLVQIYDIQTETSLSTTYQNGPIKALTLVENGNVAVLSSTHLSFLRFPFVTPKAELCDAEIETTLSPGFNPT